MQVFSLMLHIQDQGGVGLIVFPHTGSGIQVFTTYRIKEGGGGTGLIIFHIQGGLILHVQDQGVRRTDRFF